jgi:hypothetical protein
LQSLSGVIGGAFFCSKENQMSYCEIIAFRDGIPAESKEFGNAHGGAAFVWDALYQRYLANPFDPFGHYLKDAQKLWNLVRDPRLSLAERIVHASTFDRAIVRSDSFSEYARALREFEQHHHNPGLVCHLLGWAEFVEGCGDAEAIGFYQMSVSENLWFTYTDDDVIPYNIRRNDNEIRIGNPHFDVYERYGVG